MNKRPLTDKQKAVLRGLGVQAVYLFGSRALGKEGPLSDYDYGVLLSRPGHHRGDPIYDRLYDLFAEISPRTLANDVIDIVFLRDIGLELRFHVVRYGVVIFETDSGARVNFESDTVLLYSDFRPLLDRFDEAIMESL